MQSHINVLVLKKEFGDKWALMLRERGFEVDVSVIEGTAIPRDVVPEIIVLEFVFSGLIQLIREYTSTPILVLRQGEGRRGDVAACLDAGADDFVSEPVHPDEVSARLRALMRRERGKMRRSQHIGPMCIDFLEKRVLRDGVNVGLTAHEYLLLERLVIGIGKAVSREEIKNHIYHDDNRPPSSNIIQVFVARVRRKIGKGIRIQTVRANAKDDREGGYVLLSPQ